MQRNRERWRALLNAVAHLKQPLIAKVLRVQRRISCSGCGLCCTERFNSVRILPVEAAVIAEHLQTFSRKRRHAFIERMRQCITRFALKRGGKSALYTCPFLEADFSCALPFEVKPVACLSFNPVSRDQCDQSEPNYFAVHDAVEQLNRRMGTDERRASIPIMVLEQLAQDSPGDRSDRK